MQSSLAIPLDLAERVSERIGMDSDLGRELREVITKAHVDKLDGRQAQAVIRHTGKRRQVCAFVLGHKVSEPAARRAITTAFGVSVGSWKMAREWWTGDVATGHVKAARGSDSSAIAVTTIPLEAW